MVSSYQALKVRIFMSPTLAHESEFGLVRQYDRARKRLDGPPDVLCMLPPLWLDSRLVVAAATYPRLPLEYRPALCGP